MKIWIAGKDRSDELEAGLARAAAGRGPGCAPALLLPHHSALALRAAKDTREYQDILLDLLRIRRGITTADFEIPRRPGFLGAILARLRAFLWKLFRYQHDRMAFQQNILNELTIGALEFERDQRLRDLEELRTRLKSLEGGMP